MPCAVVRGRLWTPLAGLPQRQSMELGEVESVMGLYLNVLLGAVKGRVRRLF